MADHFALMAGRLLTLPSAVHDQAAVLQSSTMAASDHSDGSVAEDRRSTMSGVMVDCRICQEEGDEGSMENPCSCKGSIKYAHHMCIQRWCNEKGDTTCEICLQQFTPNYSAPLKLFRLGRNPVTFRRSEETPDNLDADRRQENVAQNADHTAGTWSFGSQGSDAKGAVFCRVVAIALMALLVLRDAISLVLGDSEAQSMALITHVLTACCAPTLLELLMFRTAGVVIPIYIILISVVTLLNRYNQHQAVHQTDPNQQHVISIQ